VESTAAVDGSLAANDAMAFGAIEAFQGGITGSTPVLRKTRIGRVRLRPRVHPARVCGINSDATINIATENFTAFAQLHLRPGRGLPLALEN